MPATACPECAAPVTVADDTRISEIVQCADCHSELEVLTTTPLVVALAPDIEEDWGE